MNTTFLFLLAVLLLTVEISSKQRKRKPNQTKKPKTFICSIRRSCPQNSCVPFYSECTGARGLRLFSKKCYIHAQCPDNQTCSIFLGFCLRKPKCNFMKPYSFCIHKAFCPCPEGYECRRKFFFPRCLPIETGSGDLDNIIVN